MLFRSIQGIQGETGATGANGADGVSVINANVATGNLVMTMSNSSIIDAGTILSNTGVTAGTYGNAQFGSTPVITVDAKGRVTSASSYTPDLGVITTLQNTYIWPTTDANFQSVSATGNVTGAYLLGNASQVSGLATVAKSGSYNDLSNKPTIPTHTSNLTNNSGFITDRKSTRLNSSHT